MKITKIIILCIITTFSIFIISSCGVNSPTSSIGNNQTTSNTLGNINAYQSTIHQYNLTRNAVEVLLYNNPTGLTQKQLDILKYYQADIEAGAHDEDYDPPYPTKPGQDPSVKRTINHFMDPIHDTA